MCVCVGFLLQQQERRRRSSIGGEDMTRVQVPSRASFGTSDTDHASADSHGGGVTFAMPSHTHSKVQPEPHFKVQLCEEEDGAAPAGIGVCECVCVCT